MSFEHYIRSGDTMLRCGYTTGTCAALAAMGAVRLLLDGTAPKVVELLTPKGLTVSVTPSDCGVNGDTASCSIVKDSGDDPDITNGITVTVTVRKTEGSGVSVDGGEGVGIVTRPGLDQPVGNAAINRVPRQMIRDGITSVCEELGYDLSSHGIAAVVSVPNGEEIAAKTFNPLLGIEGGISILGTGGIVEPMSRQALIDTIQVEIRQARAEGGTRLILAPGNYGMDYLKDHGLTDLGVPVVKFSNYLGEALDAAKAEGIEEVLLVGHIGKLVKLAGGIMNTHSKAADCRRELFTAHAAICGADTDTCRALMQADTTDACLGILDTKDLTDDVMRSLLSAMASVLERRFGAAGAVVFSNQYGTLGQTKKAEELLEQWRKGTQEA